MTSHFLIEAVGYLGSLIIILSMLLTNVVKLRVANVVGCIVFGTYALIIHSIPTVIIQACLIIVHTIALYKLLSAKNNYTVIQLQPGESFLNSFLADHAADITRFFEAVPAANQYNCAYLTICEYRNIGVLLGTKIGDTLTVHIDYTIPQYRDCTAGAYLYEYLAGTGVRRFVADATSSEHAGYLKKMNFCYKDGKYVKDV
ncbi:MAG: YgjV family protein [Treponema sp.]|nr:YgjV family protein [Treponema sp.]